jgi:hypothetical protein
MSNIYYIHGSADSVDKDIFYVFDEMPLFQDAKRFCDASKKKIEISSS